VQIVFRRTGQRQYAVEARRHEFDDVVMSPAPGYDDHLPHDLIHFLVERHWRIQDGIFGQVAAGGDARTFVPVDVPRNKRWAKRSAKRNTVAGHGVQRSETLAYVIHVRWHQRHDGHLVPPQLSDRIEVAGATAREIEECLAEADRVSRQWRQLGVGGELRFNWPWPERGRAGRRVA
jgi:hypothetical protein